MKNKYKNIVSFLLSRQGKRSLLVIGLMFGLFFIGQQTFISLAGQEPETPQSSTLPFLSISALAENTATATATPLDKNEPQNDSPDGASNLLQNTDVQSYFSKTNDVDWFSFASYNDNKIYTIETNESKDNAFPKLELYLRNGQTNTLIKESTRKTDSHDAILSFNPSEILNATSTDTIVTFYTKVTNQLPPNFPQGDLSLYAYKIKLSTATGQTSQNQDAFEPDNLPNTSNINTDGSIQQRNFHDSTDEDWVKFYVGFSDSTYTAETTVTQGTLGDTVMELYGPNFDIYHRNLSPYLDQNDNKSTSDLGSIITFRPSALGLAQGAYYLHIFPKFNTTNVGPNATYSLKVTYVTPATPIPTNTPITGDQYEPDNSSSQAKEMGAGETQPNHNFHNATDVDWTKFYASLDSYIYTIQTTNLGKLADTVMELYGPDGKTLLLSNDNTDENTSASTLTFTPKLFSGANIYYIKVYPKNPLINIGEKSNYDLAITSTAPPPTPVFPIAPDKFEIEPEDPKTPDDDQASMASWIPQIDTTSDQHTFHKATDVDWIRFNISMIGRYRILASNAATIYLYNSSLNGHLASNVPDDAAYYPNLPNTAPATTTPAPSIGTPTNGNALSLASEIQGEKLDEPALSSMVEYNFYYPGTYYVKLSPRNDTALSNSQYNIRIISLIPTPTTSPTVIDSSVALPDGVDTTYNFGDNLPETARPFHMNWERSLRSLHNTNDQDWSSILITSPQVISFRFDNLNKLKYQFKIMRVFAQDDQTQTGMFEWTPWGKVTFPNSNIMVNTEIIKNLYIDNSVFAFNYNFTIPGTYYIGIMNPDSVPNKYYRLLINATSDTNPIDIWDRLIPINNSIDTATLLIPNAMEQKHNFTDITDQDWLTFYGKEKQSYTISLYSKQKTHVYLFEKSSNGLVILKEKTFNGNDSFDFTPSTTDTYYLHFTPSSELGSLPIDNEYAIRINTLEYNTLFPQDFDWSLQPTTPTATATPTGSIIATTPGTNVSATMTPTITTSNTATITNTPSITNTVTITNTATPTNTETATATTPPFFLTPNTFSDRLSVLVLFTDTRPTVIPQSSQNTSGTPQATVVATPTAAPIPIAPGINLVDAEQYTAIPITGAKVTLSSYGKVQYTDYNGQTMFEGVTPAGKYIVFAEFQGEVKWVEVDTTQQRYAKILFYPQILSGSAPATINDSTNGSPKTMPVTGMTISLGVLCFILILLSAILYKTKKLLPALTRIHSTTKNTLQLATKLPEKTRTSFIKKKTQLIDGITRKAKND
ncbi:MAG: hypothetical protein WCP97_02185 [bacterium]